MSKDVCADGKRAIVAVTMGSKRRRRRAPVETETQSSDWNEHGGTRIWVAGDTSNGVPLGVTEEELQLRESGSRVEAWGR
jgi:hypothetical protein